MIKRPAYPPRDTAIVMRSVLLALIPGIVTMTIFFGPGVLFNLVTGVLTAVAAEALCISLRGRALKPRLRDLSAALTGVLIALSLPQAAPWWLTVAASGSSIILGKHLYGGLGQNPVNPAMLGYALMLISAPVAMTTLWINPLTTPGFGAAWVAYVGQANDALTGATMLDLYRTEFLSLTAIEASDHPLFTNAHLGLIYGYEWAALAYLIGWPVAHLSACYHLAYPSRALGHADCDYRIFQCRSRHRDTCVGSPSRGGGHLRCVFHSDRSRFGSDQSQGTALVCDRCWCSNLLH